MWEQKENRDEKIVFPCPEEGVEIRGSIGHGSSKVD